MRLQSYLIPNTSGIVAKKLFVWSAVSVIKSQYFDHSQRASEIVVTQVPETFPRMYAKRVCCKKYRSPVLMWSELVFFSACPISGGLQPTTSIRKAIVLNSNKINVETSFHHANHSAAFVSCRLLWFNLIPKLHQSLITCWCVLSSDFVNTFE